MTCAEASAIFADLNSAPRAAAAAEALALLGSEAEALRLALEGMAAAGVDLDGSGEAFLLDSVLWPAVMEHEAGR